MNAIDCAEGFIDRGVPVVVCQPCAGYGSPGTCDRHSDGSTELHMPSGWNTITAAECDLGAFVPGESVLALVGGHGVDVVDVDTKGGVEV